MRVAVTAASGGLGRAIITQLKNIIQHHQIVGIARTPSKAEDLGVEIRKGDYKQKEHFKGAFKDINTVLIVSGMDAPENRIEQHSNIIDAARESGVNKVVYTSIIGTEHGNTFSPIVHSNRQTEEKLINSGLEWVIGRNGLYIEPDIEYVKNYKNAGKISNCASDGKCSYTTRGELGYAYSQMILKDKNNGNIYNLAGEAITQGQLTDFINSAFNLNLIFESVSIEYYRKERVNELGEFLGTIISGIYEGIRNGDMNVDSDFRKAAGRDHIGWDEYFSKLKIGHKF